MVDLVFNLKKKRCYLFKFQKKLRTLSIIFLEKNFFFRVFVSFIINSLFFLQRVAAVVCFDGFFAVGEAFYFFFFFYDNNFFSRIEF
jgi:hypothetical protein